MIVSTVHEVVEIHSDAGDETGMVSYTLRAIGTHQYITHDWLIGKYPDGFALLPEDLKVGDRVEITVERIAP